LEDDPMSDDQDHCMGLIKPLLPAVDEALRFGMDFYQKSYSTKVVAQHRDRTSADCVYDHAFHHFRELLDGKRGNHFLNVGGLELLNYRDIAVLRLKKVNASGRWRNAQTKQQKAFDDQRPFAEFPPEAVRLVAGYEPDAAFSAIQRVIISRPMGKNILWAAQVVVLDKAASWTDITPARLDGTERVDFRSRRGAT
jgi:hypothetical protein